MKTFKVPVVWQMMGYREVEAETLEDACHKVMEDGAPLPEGNYLDESFGLDREGVQEKDPDADLSVLPEDYWK